MISQLLFLLLLSLAHAASKPNFIFIVSDDQDVQLDSLKYMPLLRKHMTEQGTSFNKHYCTTARCCPSRVTLWTGKAAHNTNVTDVKGDFGGYKQFLREHWDKKYLPIWLQDAGYKTYYVGKFLNAMSRGNYDPKALKGWDDRDFLLEPYTYTYYNVTMRRNDQEPTSYLNQYSTDVIAQRGVEYLNDAHATGKPFFIGIAPVGPHVQTTPPGHTEAEYPHHPMPANRHADLFPGVQVPDNGNFNPDKTSGASYVKRLEKLNDTVVDYLHQYQRWRLQTLQAVDELVEKVVSRVEDLGLSDNTYIVYTSDNGYHVGQHRLQPGKSCAYEEDINVPLIVRGPGVAKGKTVDNIPTTHTDWVPTLLKLAGINQELEFDGTPIPIIDDIKPVKHEHVSVEFWGNQHFEGKYHFSRPTNTYKSLRVIGGDSDYSLSYTVWCSNEHELYDMSTDSAQMNNLLPATENRTDITIGSNKYSVPQVHARLDALVQVLRTCNGTTCVQPWGKLHPSGNVNSLVDALDTDYDHFYEQEQVKMKFSKCDLGYFPKNEGPGPVSYDGNKIDRRELDDWVYWTSNEGPGNRWEDYT